MTVFQLRQLNESQLTFGDVFAQPIQKTIKQCRQELLRFDAQSPARESVENMRKACDIASELRVWRNDRIHAHAEWSEHGYALYNSRTGKRLEITAEGSEENIRRTIEAIVLLKAKFNIWSAC
jgi:hypothetical protein